MLKNPMSMKAILHRQNNWQFIAKFILLHYYMSLLVIARQLWWMNLE
jgi:hypothetical protein